MYFCNLPKVMDFDTRNLREFYQYIYHSNTLGGCYNCRQYGCTWLWCVELKCSLWLPTKCNVLLPIALQICVDILVLCNRNSACPFFITFVVSQCYLLFLLLWNFHYALVLAVGYSLILLM